MMDGSRRPKPGRHGGRILISSTSSDAHTWNLVYLQLAIEEFGFDVANLGACVPDVLLLTECRSRRPDLVVISTVNGHGLNEGPRIGALLRRCPELSGTPLVIGGKLGTTGALTAADRDRLRQAGFDYVFDHDELALFYLLLEGLDLALPV